MKLSMRYSRQTSPHGGPFIDFVYSRTKSDGSQQYLMVSGEPMFDSVRPLYRLSRNRQRCYGQHPIQGKFITFVRSPRFFSGRFLPRHHFPEAQKIFFLVIQADFLSFSCLLTPATLRPCLSAAAAGAPAQRQPDPAVACPPVSRRESRSADRTWSQGYPAYSLRQIEIV